MSLSYCRSASRIPSAQRRTNSRNYRPSRRRPYPGQAKPNKYNNRRAEIDGKTFASRAEMRFYLKLKQQVLDKEILEFECQPKIELFPDPFNKGRQVVYIPDFRVVRNDEAEFFVDVKGPETAKEKHYRLKIKCLKHFYPALILHEYVYGPKGKVTEAVY